MGQKSFILMFLILVAGICTTLIYLGGNHKYNEVSKTGFACIAENFIPEGKEIHIYYDQTGHIITPGSDVKPINIQLAATSELYNGDKKLSAEDQFASIFVTDPKELIGKSLLVGVMPGNLIFKSQVSDKEGIEPGYVCVGVPTNQSSSDQVVAGDMVNVLAAVQQGGNLPGAANVIVQNVKVLASYDQTGHIITPGSSESGGAFATVAKSKVPSMVDLMIPQDKEALVAGYAKNNQIYLTRR